MPKGVEHILDYWKANPNQNPRNSVMPKGVEHVGVLVLTKAWDLRETP